MTTKEKDMDTPMRHAIVRIDRSPMNPKVWVVQLDCGHDVYKHRKPTMRQRIECERCRNDD